MGVNFGLRSQKNVENVHNMCYNDSVSLHEDGKQTVWGKTIEAEERYERNRSKKISLQ